MKTGDLVESLSLKNNRKFKIFLFFLILTSIIWLLIELSKSYVSTVNFNVEYTNIPADKLLQSSPNSKLDFVIKAPGFSLLRYNIKSPSVQLNLETVLKQKGKFFLLPNNQISNLNKQLPSDVEVVNVVKDTLFIELGINISKKIPVVSNVDVKFKLGYNYLEKLRVTPDSVVIIGPEKYLDTISKINTVSLKLAEVYETIDQDIELLIPNNNKHITISNEKVRIFGEVDKFTEGILNIPVTIINEPENGDKLNPFPKEIKIIYTVSLSNFNKVNANSVSVIFDYMEYKNDSLIQYLSPVIQQKSEYIHSLKIVPSKVEFLIQK